tara:strand:- start:6563 stop:7735 length:1173 start_codon:yes stop_codon:yes gene_type:complete
MSINKKTFRTGSSVGFIAGSFKYDGVGTGSNTADVSVTGLGFEPDLLWIFPRDENDTSSRKNFVIDRAFAGSTETMHISGGGVIQTVRANNDIITWGTDGFTLHARSNYTGSNKPHSTFNRDGSKYCGIAFKTTTSGATNNDGNTTSTVFVNADGAFSKVTFTSGGGSTTIGHGLGVKPEVMLCIRTNLSLSSASSFGDSRGGATIFDDTDNDFRGGQGFSNTQFSRPLDSSSNHMSANTSTISVHSSSSLGGDSGVDYVIYAFAPKSGFFDRESYVGNASSSTRTILSADFAPIVAFIPGENRFHCFHPDRANSGTPRTGTLNFFRVPGNQAVGGLELEDNAMFSNETGSVNVDGGNQDVRLSSSESDTNANGFRYGCFAFGGDMFSIA